MLEHPDITSAILTGYPVGHEEDSWYCEECGKDITDDVIYFDDEHEFLCEKCLLHLHEKNWW